MVFTVPRNTLETAPFEQNLKISSGILHQVSVVIPPGHACLTGCALDIGLHQIAPTNQNEWFKGDDTRWMYPEYIEIPPGEHELNLRGYNTDDTYDHAFILGVGILPIHVYNAITNLSESMRPMISDMDSLAKFFSPPKTLPGA